MNPQYILVSILVEFHESSIYISVNRGVYLVILGVTFDAKMTFEKPFALFPVLQLRGLVS